MMSHDVTWVYTTIHQYSPSSISQSERSGNRLRSSDPPIRQGGGLLAPRRDVSLHGHHCASALNFSFDHMADFPTEHRVSKLKFAVYNGSYEISGATKRDGEVTFSAKRKQPCRYSGIDTNILAILASRIRVCRLVLEIE